MSLPAEKPQAPRIEPAPVPRRSGSLNLARRPFINTRPVTRVSILLWILGLLLLFGNVSLFWNYYSGSAEKRTELEGLQQNLERQQQTLTQLEQRLASLDLERQNRRVRFLNRKIAERTFSWSLLFDRLAEVLPDDVRLTRLAPDRKQAPGQREEDEGPTDNRVRLVIQGQSRSDDAHFDFVRRLFAHGSFEDPDIPRESREEKEGIVDFDVRVVYIPGDPVQQGPAPQEIVIEEEAPAGAPGAPAAPAVPGTGGRSGPEPGR